MSDFKHLFLREYLKLGLGAMPKRDVDALVMYLLDTYGMDDGKPLKELSNQEASIKLRVPVSRIKSLRYEARLKYADTGDQQIKIKFLEILKKSELNIEDKKIIFVVEDFFIQKWLHGVTKDHGLVLDSSFNAEVVKVAPDSLCRLLSILYDTESVAILHEHIREAIDKPEKISYREVKNEFIKTVISKLTEVGVEAGLKMLLV